MSLTTVQGFTHDDDKKKQVKSLLQKFCNSVLIEHPEFREVIQQENMDAPLENGLAG